MKTEKNKHRRELEKSLTFLEDLCWLLDSGKKNDYSEIIKILSDIKNNNSLNNNPDELVGILPKLLTDITLFDTNRALAQFSDEILGVEILNWNKRSRNEMIGVIICKVQESDEIREGISSYLLNNILKNKDEIKKIQTETENANHKFLWNDAIHKIVGENNE